jgi:large subunit ribosomal protein L35
MRTRLPSREPADPRLRQVALLPGSGVRRVVLPDNHEETMGKTGKSRNAAAKRFKKSGTGKIMRRHACCGHLLTKKSRKRKRTTGTEEVISAADRKVLSSVLPKSGRA